MKHFALFLAALFLLYSCNMNQPPVKTTGNSEKLNPFSTIVQPIKSLAPAFITLVLSNAKGILHKTEKGSVIMVPAEAFVYEDGSKVEGEVSLEFKEMFNSADIILSGIPMNVKNNEGIVTPFISDGMFEIKAGCNGKAVQLSKGKSISVTMPSSKKEKDFQYWFFNQGKGEWESTGSRDEVLNEDQVLEEAKKVNPEMASDFSLKNNTDRLNTVAPVKASYEKDANVSNLVQPLKPEVASDKDFLFTINDNYNHYPELSGYKNVLWKPVTELTVKEQKDLNTKMSAYGANVALKCIDENKQIYQISYGNSKLNARPVFIGKDKAKAEKEYKAKLQNYNKELSRQKKAAEYAEKTREKFVKTYSMFQVNNMGIYNCDRFYSYNGTKKNYRFKTSANPVDEHVFAILSNNQGVIALSSAYKVGQYYNLPANEITGFVHTAPDGSIFVSSLKPESAKEINDVELSFRQKTPANANEFAQIIKSL